MLDPRRYASLACQGPTTNDAVVVSDLNEPEVDLSLLLSWVWYADMVYFVWSRHQNVVFACARDRSISAIYLFIFYYTGKGGIG